MGLEHNHFVDGRQQGKTINMFISKTSVLQNKDIGILSTLISYLFNNMISLDDFIKEVELLESFTQNEKNNIIKSAQQDIRNRNECAELINNLRSNTR